MGITAPVAPWKIGVSVFVEGQGGHFEKSWCWVVNLVGPAPRKKQGPADGVLYQVFVVTRSWSKA